MLTVVPTFSTLLTVDLALGPGDTQRREGFEILQAALRANPGIKAVVITSDQEKITAMQAVRMGACDYFVKPLPLEELRGALKRAAYVSELEGASIPANDFSESTGIIGESTPMVE